MYKRQRLYIGAPLFFIFITLLQAAAAIAQRSSSYSSVVTYYYDSPNGKQNSATDYSPTGYVLVKYIHPNDAWDGDNARSCLLYTS